MEFLFAEQHTAFAQQFHDVAIGIEDIFPSEIWQTGFLSKAAVIVHGRQNRQTMRAAEIVIVFAMAWCDVHRAGATVHGHKIGSQHDSVAIKKWMACFDVIDLRAGK